MEIGAAKNLLEAGLRTAGSGIIAVMSPVPEGSERLLAGVPGMDVREIGRSADVEGVIDEARSAGRIPALQLGFLSPSSQEDAVVAAVRSSRSGGGPIVVAGDSRAVQQGLRAQVTRAVKSIELT